jgi:paraquat-inducible protein B
MANRSNHASFARIGFAILIATVAIIATLVCLGGLRGHRNEILAETYYDREVSGLSKGSAVNFRGVKIGEVREIDFVGNKYAAKDNDVLRIYILMALDPKKIGYLEGENIDAEETIPYLVKERGLRASVTASGITGLSRIECNLNPELVGETETFDWKPKHIFIPQKTSLLASASDVATRVLNQIKAMDFGAAWTNVSQSVESLSRTMQAAQTFVESKRESFEQTVDNVSEASADLKEFVREVKANPSCLLRETKPEPLAETR